MRDKIEIVDPSTGEIIDKSIIDSIKKKEWNDNIKRVKWLYENNPSAMTREDIEFLCLKIHNRNKNVKLDFKKDKNDPDCPNRGFCTLKISKSLTRELSLVTKGFIYEISYMLSGSNKILFGNDKRINSYAKLCAEIGIPYSSFKKNIKPEIDKYKIIKKSKLDDKTYLVLNPLYLTRYTDITEDLFLTFYRELKKYLHPLDYLMLCGRWNVDYSI